MNERQIREYSDQWGIVYDKCSGYLAQVADGHLSLDDANDAICDRMSHLPSDISGDISELLWEKWKHLTTTQTTEEKPMEKVSFIGRKSGAIGIFYRIYSLVPKGCTTKEALAYLYDRYEGISELIFLDRK